MRRGRCSARSRARDAGGAAEEAKMPSSKWRGRGILRRGGSVAATTLGHEAEAEVEKQGGSPGKTKGVEISGGSRVATRCRAAGSVGRTARAGSRSGCDLNERTQPDRSVTRHESAHVPGCDLNERTQPVVVRFVSNAIHMY